MALLLSSEWSTPGNCTDPKGRGFQCEVDGKFNQVPPPCIHYSSTQLPLESERNGVIISYRIFYRRVPQNISADPPFSNATYLRNDTADVLHSLTVEGLEELMVYQVKLYASTSVGDGPESELMNVTTARRKNLCVAFNLNMMILL